MNINYHCLLSPMEELGNQILVIIPDIKCQLAMCRKNVQNCIYWLLRLVNAFLAESPLDFSAAKKLKIK